MEPNAQALINFMGDYTKFTEHVLDENIQTVKNGMESLFSEVQRIDAEINEENKKTSDQFCFFDLFDEDIDENKMSDILAFLLDPEQSHGQDSLYLKEFCTWLNITPGPYTGVKITREENRIDILLKFSNTYVIIENKYRGAQDQEQQIERYYNYVRDRLGATPDKIYVVYMTQEGTRPSEVSLKDENIKKDLNGRLRLVSFRKKFKGVAEEDALELIPLLEKCKTESNLKMEFFLDELTTYIKREDEKMEKFEEEIFNWLMADDCRTKSACQINELFGKYSQHLRLDFIDELTKEIKKTFSEMGQDWIVSREDKEIKIFKQSWEYKQSREKYCIWLVAETAKFYYGLYPDPSGQLHHVVREKARMLSAELDKLIKPAEEPFDKSSEDGAIWWRYFKTHTIEDRELVKLLPRNRGKLIAEWVYDLKEFAECIDKNTSIKIEDMVSVAGQ